MGEPEASGGGFFGRLIAAVVAFTALIIAVRENWHITVVLVVFCLILLYYHEVITYLKRRYRYDPLKPKRNGWISFYSVFIIAAPLIAGGLLLKFVPGTTDYVTTAFTGTATPTAQPTLTITPSPKPTRSEPTNTVTAAPAPTQAACYCAMATDDLTIRCLIGAESQAANEGSLEIISGIFSPDATVFRGNDPQETWNSPLEYYQPLFRDYQFRSAIHFDITHQGSLGKTQLYVSGSSGYYQKKSGGSEGRYENPAPSDHWALTKNEQGCWVITHYEFNAAHLAFPRE